MSVSSRGKVRPPSATCCWWNKSLQSSKISLPPEVSASRACHFSHSLLSHLCSSLHTLSIRLACFCYLHRFQQIKNFCRQVQQLTEMCECCVYKRVWDWKRNILKGITQIFLVVFMAVTRCIRAKANNTSRHSMNSSDLHYCAVASSHRRSTISLFIVAHFLRNKIVWTRK